MNDTTSQHPLDLFFAPRTVAVIGATDAPNTYGRSLLWNLINQPFGGTVLPINPRRLSVLGIRAYPSVAALGEPVDLALIVTPAPTVPEVIAECAAAGVRGAIILSAGFHESGADGPRLAQQSLAHARASGMRLLGPGSLGLMRPHSGLNATLTQPLALPGSVGFISQSAALCSAVLDWSIQEHVGFSALVSVGGMIDVGWGELIDYLGDDPLTGSIVIYLETIGEVRALLSAAREVALSKPIIVLKAGHSSAGGAAARSHTGRIADDDAALDAAFRRCGVLRVTSVIEMFAMAEVLAKQPRPHGRRLSIVTNAGAPGVLAADALVGGGGALAELSAETRAALDQALPPNWSQTNPVDILGSADALRYGAACAAAARDRASDGLLVILTPQLISVDPAEAAEQVIAHTRGVGRPVLASWMGGASSAAGKAILNRAGIPTFPYPDLAARAFTRMWEHSHVLRSLYETPGQPPEARAGCERAGALVAAAQAQRRALLNRAESLELLTAYGIPAAATRVAASAEEAEAHAGALGYPVALKPLAPTPARTAAQGGTHLHLGSAGAVRRAFQTIAAAGPEGFAGVIVQPMELEDGYELLLGCTTDPQFGPLLLFGAGGRLVETLQDHALALPPLTTTLARRLMERTRIFDALRRSRADLALLEQILVRLSQLVVEQRRIKELDINPLRIDGERALALGARVLLHDPDLPAEELPPLAVRPYPAQYAGAWSLRDGTPVAIRPIRPDDEPLMVDFHQTLSEQSVYFRYFHQLGLAQRVTHERLARMCFIDYDRAIALVMLRHDPDSGPHILAIARLMRQHGTREAEFALLVSDRYQRHGIGLELMSRLLAIGRAEGVRRIVGYILPENTGMRRICERLGFKTRRADGMIEAAVDLGEE
jgi:acetyltransferase